MQGFEKGRRGGVKSTLKFSLGTDMASLVIGHVDREIIDNDIGAIENIADAREKTDS